MQDWFDELAAKADAALAAKKQTDEKNRVRYAQTMAQGPELMKSIRADLNQAILRFNKKYLLPEQMIIADVPSPDGMAFGCRREHFPRVRTHLSADYAAGSLKCSIATATGPTTHWDERGHLFRFDIDSGGVLFISDGAKYSNDQIVKLMLEPFFQFG